MVKIGFAEETLTFRYYSHHCPLSEVGCVDILIPDITNGGLRVSPVEPTNCK